MADQGEATILDDLSGFEFEDVMEDVFRNLGYVNVHQAARIADEGRDILMEETVEAGRRAVVVECKHTDSVGRPTVQKLHSAVATYEYDGPKRGMVATTGRFTGPAQEYVAQLRESNDPHPVELLDGADLRTVAEEVGLDLYNGRVEILCDRTLRPYDPVRGPDGAVRDAVRDVENLSPAELPDPERWLDFAPHLRIRADVDAVFETTVGVVHRVHERADFVVSAGIDGPTVPDGSVRDLVATNLDQAIELDEASEDAAFDQAAVKRFGETETEYKEWAVKRLQRVHTTTVQYTGDNNVSYTKRCEPNQSDISVRSIQSVYLPRIRASVELGEYTYSYEYHAAGPSRVPIDDGIHRCVHCDDTESSYTYCANCGSINCTDHIRTERLEGEPVCTGCAVSDRFFFRRNYFYDQENLDAFRAEYEEMPPFEKAKENRPLLAGVAVSALLVVLVVLFAVV